jgi:hypothetical protein
LAGAKQIDLLPERGATSWQLVLRANHMSEIFGFILDLAANLFFWVDLRDKE